MCGNTHVGSDYYEENILYRSADRIWRVTQTIEIPDCRPPPAIVDGVVWKLNGRPTSITDYKFSTGCVGGFTAEFVLVTCKVLKKYIYIYVRRNVRSWKSLLMYYTWTVFVNRYSSTFFFFFIFIFFCSYYKSHIILSPSSVYSSARFSILHRDIDITGFYHFNDCTSQIGVLNYRLQ